MIDRSKFLFLTNLKFIFCVYFIVAVTASIHRYLLGPEHYGNYLIFKNSFFHLLGGNNLYVSYPELKIDLFKYSPTFAVLFSPLAILPDFLGLILWNLLNALLLFVSIKMIAFEEKKKAFILWIVLFELVTSLQNFQSNGLTASLIIFTYVALEKRNYLSAGIWVALGFYIKIFGILAGLLWFMFKGKLKFLASAFVSLGILFLLPIIFVSPAELIKIYTGWVNLILTDPVHELNHSVMSVLKNILGIEADTLWIQIAGILFLMFPLFRWNLFENKLYRLLFLSSILIWSVIFNHKAESPTYVIAVAGCAIWFFNSKKKMTDWTLLVLMFILTCLSPTDLFPKVLRENFFIPYSVKAIPCILIWVKIQYELFFLNKTERAN